MGAIIRKTVGEQIKDIKEFEVLYTLVDGKPNTNIKVDGKVSALTLLSVLAQCTDNVMKVLGDTQDLELHLIRTVFRNILEALGEEK